MFASNKNMDASVRVDTTDAEALSDAGLLVTSINAAGLHRTSSEIAKKGELNESVLGGNLDYKGRSGSIGITAANIHYNSPLSLNTSLYQYYREQGQNFANVGVNYQSVWRNTNFFGEASRSSNGGWGTINGVVASLHPNVALSLLHRHFSNDYQALYANVFAENQDRPANERGLFAGVQTTWAKGWTFVVYMDLVKYPWLRYRVDAPSTESDYLLQLNYKPNRKDEFYVRFRRAVDVLNSSTTEARIQAPVPNMRDNFRINASYFVHPNVQLKSRMDWIFYEMEGTRQNGYLLYQDVVFKKIGLPVQFVARYALFRTDDWNARLYAYENDVLYSFSIPAHSGVGSRMYAMASWDIRKGLELQVRYARWLYSDKQRIGSGTQEIQGNRLSDVHIMLRWRI
jgi:hypothetical protein